MDPAVATHEPSTFAAGETVQWRRGVGSYAPADGWALRYYFAGPDTFQASASVDGSDFLVTLRAVDTEGKAPGEYRWTAYAERGEGEALERIRIASGRATLHANITTTQPGAFESHSVRMLRAIRTVLEGRVPAEVENFTIGGKAITQIPFSELRRAERRYALRVKRERNGGRLPRTEVHFGRA